MNVGAAQGITLANKITISRLALIPVFIVCLIYQLPGAAFTVFLTASVADGVDGYLARSRGERTALGAMLDPAADKLLMLSAFVVMGAQGHIPFWLAAVVVGRDFMLSVGYLSIYALAGFVPPAPTAMGKATTVMQMLSVSFALAAWTLGVSENPWLMGLYSLTCLLTFASGAHYLFFVGERMRSRRTPAPGANEQPSVIAQDR